MEKHKRYKHRSRCLQPTPRSSEPQVLALNENTHQFNPGSKREGKASKELVLSVSNPLLKAGHAGGTSTGVNSPETQPGPETGGLNLC